MTATNMCSNFGGKWDSHLGEVTHYIYIYIYIDFFIFFIVTKHITQFIFQI